MSYSFVPAHATSMAYESPKAAPVRGPTRDDWERCRPLLKRLYIDEGKKLKDVMAIMTQYGHSATSANPLS
jgi:hypothetical protein